MQIVASPPDMRGSSHSSPEHSLLLGKPHTVNEITWSRLNFFPNKNCFSHSFQNRFDIWCQNCMLGFHVTICVNKQHTNAVFGCSWFQKFNFEFLLNEALYLFTKNLKHIQICVTFTDSAICHDSRDSNILHLLFGL